MAGDFLARKIGGSQRRARIPGNRLNINVMEGAARFQGADQKTFRNNPPARHRDCAPVFS